MTDEVDMAFQIEGETIARGVAQARGPIAPGAAGDCDDCGHYMLRLVGGRCAFCRDGRLPPDDWEPPQRPANLPKRTPPMKTRTISLPSFADAASAAIDDLAEREDLAVGHAAAKLIEAGHAALTAEPPVEPAAEAAPTAIDLGAQPLDALLDELHRRFDGVAETTARAEALAVELQSVREAVAIAIR